VADADLVLHVVDGSHPDPATQLSAVRQVLAEVGALDVPEVVVVNKTDAADPVVLQRLLAAEPGSVAVSARTGAGLDELRERIAARLPEPDVRVELLVPYTHGEVLARVHDVGLVDELEHTGDGTRVVARVPGWVAADLARYDVAAPAAEGHG
jgi:GTP-binding protein HflX